MKLPMSLMSFFKSGILENSKTKYFHKSFGNIAIDPKYIEYKNNTDFLNAFFNLKNPEEDISDSSENNNASNFKL